MLLMLLNQDQEQLADISIAFCSSFIFGNPNVRRGVGERGQAGWDKIPTFTEKGCEGFPYSS